MSPASFVQPPLFHNPAIEQRPGHGVVADGAQRHGHLLFACRQLRRNPVAALDVLRPPVMDVLETDLPAVYGRNYLIPTGKAVIASPSAKKMLAEELKQRAHKLEKIKKDAEAMAEQLKDVTLTIATKVSATGTIFGSVSNIQIAEELEKLGHKVDRKIIVVKDAVKEVGSYKAIVKLHKEVSVEIPFEVVAE